MAIVAFPDVRVASNGAAPGVKCHSRGRWKVSPCCLSATDVQPSPVAGLETSGGLVASLPHPPRARAAAALISADALRTARTVSAPPGGLARGARMRPEVDVLQALGRQVRVDLGGGNVGVAEHLLHRPQVATAGEQMRGERVAQRVRTHLALQPRRTGVALDDLVEALPRQLAAPLVD